AARPPLTPETDMKGVHCSWVDMSAIRLCLSAKKRGDQRALTRLRCVDKATVSSWRAVYDVLDAIEGKVEISQLSHIQPSHALELARHYRRKEKPWSEATRCEIADWLDRCEAEKLTVQQLRERLRAAQPGCDEG